MKLPLMLPRFFQERARTAPFLSPWRFATSIAATFLVFTSQAQPVTNAPAADWRNQPLTLAESLDIALQKNRTILKAREDLEATHGIVVQTRAVALPKVRVGSTYQKTDPAAVEVFPPIQGNFPQFFPSISGDQRWSADIRIVQSIYEGGRIKSALRTAHLTRAQSVALYDVVVADTLLRVRTNWFDALLAEEQIGVHEASIRLLTRELEDTRRRFDAGTVPRFNVLRAEVELANSRPRLIRAKNLLRIAKHHLVNLLGFELPKDAGEEIPLQLAGKLDAEPYAVELPAAVAQALANRSELEALRKTEQLRGEAIKQAKGASKPSIQLFTGYGSRNSNFSDDLTRDVSGWFAGGQFSWDVYDGRLTRGRVLEAQALRDKARIELDDAGRQIELEVRTAYSSFVEAREVIESQKKVIEQAEEALRLATVRTDAGTGTQLDVLSAQTALTEARTIQIQALRDYAVARARVERAIGARPSSQR